jgi:3-oxoacyl-[acyl-carrier protein] reductase
VAQQIESGGGKSFALTLDLADLAKTKTAISELISGLPYMKFGVVLAAGVTGAPGELQDVDLSDWLRTFQTNLLGNLAVVQAMLPRMLEARFGRIIMFAGGGAAYGYPLFGGYAVSKVAVVRATENLNEELKAKGDFGVVCLAPGAIDTDMLTTIRNAGGEVRTLADIAEPLNFIEKFLGSSLCPFNGRFVHVRDVWEKWLDQDVILDPKQWFLRRIEL